MAVEWKDIEKGESPLHFIDCCLVMYRDDYEFGNYNGKSWQVYYDNDWVDANEKIRFWARLSRPS